MSSRHIEGYLIKEIDSEGMFRRTRRHLRYFRIVFASSRLNLKEDKVESKMRSFLLKDLTSVTVLKTPKGPIVQ